MATRGIFSPLDTYPPDSNAATLVRTAERYYLSFQGSGGNQSALIATIAPQGLSGTQTIVLTVEMASATSGDTDWDVEVESVSDGDSIDLGATASFDTANSSDNNSVPATAGYPYQVTVTLTNTDSMAAGDLVRFKITRDEVSDTATGAAHVHAIEWRDSA
jgi:hypothetical protein